MENALATTSYIKHLAISGLSNISARIKSTYNLTGKCFEMPNFSYTLPSAAVSVPLVVSIIFKSSVNLVNLFHYKNLLHYYISNFYLPQAGRLQQLTDKLNLITMKKPNRFQKPVRFSVLNYPKNG